MKNKLLILISLIFSSCSYTNTSDFTATNSGVEDLSFKDIENLKEYKSCTSGRVSLLFPPWPFRSYTVSEENLHHFDVSKTGNSAISAAVRSGGISKIKMVDYTYEVTGILSRNHCVIVYGE